MAKKIKRAHFTWGLFKPRYWPHLLGFSLWWLVVQVLPFRVQMFLGKCIGLLFPYVAKKRVKIIRRNIELCFPEMSESQLDALVRKNLISTGRAIFDSAIAWFWPQWRLQRIVKVEGLEHLEAALADNQGALMMGLHFTSLEFVSVGINRRASKPIDGVYRTHDNPVYDYVQRKGRERHNSESTAMPKQDIRGMIKCLRQGRGLAYLPDQDYGRKHSVFVPFFGISTATVTAGSQLAKMGRARVMGYLAVRNEDATGYLVKVYPELKGYGEHGDEEDAALLSRFVEERVREYPDQYLWAHRRFKTRPDGEASLY